MVKFSRTLNPHDPHVERDFFEYFTKTTSVLISFVITDSLKKPENSLSETTKVVNIA